MIFEISDITPSQDLQVCDIIKSVGAEHGAVGDGFGPSDPEVYCMSRHYSEQSKSKYYVATINEQVVGGCGLASFNNSAETCELRKLFLLPESRGLGIGQELAVKCLHYAKSKGYKRCYLDTLSIMKPAIALYEKLGFIHLNRPLAGTIHGGCDIWMLKEL